jgi:2-methylisocitrate lyase-like PEP mutase family enzyme
MGHHATWQQRLGASLINEDAMAQQTKSPAHDVAAEAEKLRKLHVAGAPLILANVWDATSARMVESAGMPAIGTSSNALAPVNGYEDHGHLPPDVAFDALRRIADAVKVPVTADLEDAYGLSPVEFVERLAAAGACGANIEDSDHRTRSLVDADRHAERIAAIKAAARARGFDPVINARVDVHIHKGPVDEGLMRARKYLDAGADCVFPIFLFDVDAIRKYADVGPTNVLYSPGSAKLEELARLGVARISVASFFFRLLMKRLQSATAALRRFDDKGLGPDWEAGLLELRL